MQTRKTEFLQIRISSHDKKLIKAAAKAAGEDMSQWILNRVLSEKSRLFLQLIQQLAHSDETSFILAEIHDFLMGLNKLNFIDATQIKPPTELNDFKANYLAAMVELRAYQLKANCPDWLNQIMPLKKPYFGSQLKSLRLYLLAHSPPPFCKRNIFIDASLGERV